VLGGVRRVRRPEKPRDAKEIVVRLCEVTPDPADALGARGRAAQGLVQAAVVEHLPEPQRVLGVPAVRRVLPQTINILTPAT
jgi:hypothetical protein